MAISEYIIPGLGNDVAVICLARIPFHELRVLRLVSKSWYLLFSTGAIYKARIWHGFFLRNLLLCRQPAEGIGSSSVFPNLELFDPLQKKTSALPPVLLPPNILQIFGLKCLSLGHDVLFLGKAIANGSRRNLISEKSNMWIVRGGLDSLAVVKDYLSSGQDLQHSCPVGLDMLVFFRENLIIDGEEIAFLNVKRITADGYIECLPVSCSFPFEEIQAWFVKNGKVYMFRKGKHTPDLIFDPKLFSWQSASHNEHRNSFYIADSFSIQTLICVAGSLYCLQKAVDDSDGTVHILVMQFDEDSAAWLTCAECPVEDVIRHVLQLKLLSFDGKLFLLRYSFTEEDDLRDYSSDLSILKLRKSGQASCLCHGEWELVFYPLGGYVSMVGMITV